MIADEKDRESREELFRDYVGQTLWVISSIQHLKTTKENDMPQYIELSHPETVKKQTASEIKETILEQLR